MFSIRVLRTFTLNSLTLAILAASAPGYADDYFNLSALETDTPLENTGALAAYLHNSGLLPGNYLTSVVWDQEFIDKRNINFLLSKDGKKLVPQFTKAELRELGVKVDTVPAL
ncbi:FimD/PapC N-terminal domain-containing protein, partial [Citrobacter sp. S55_ASV_140]